MGVTELKAALQREAEARARCFWKESEEVVAQRRREVETEVARLEAEAERQRTIASAAGRNEILYVVQQKISDCRLHAEADLSERLRQLAAAMLPELGQREHAALWDALCDELPGLTWCSVRVSPEDRARAERAFPGGEVTEDETLGGGLVVATEDGRVTVDNSLQCRLSRVWSDLLPDLMAELRGEVDGETAGADTTV